MAKAKAKIKIEAKGKAEAREASGRRKKSSKRAADPIFLAALMRGFWQRLSGSTPG